VNVECKDTQTSVWSSQYNINVAIKLSEADTKKMKLIARLKHKTQYFNFILVDNEVSHSVEITSWIRYLNFSTV
jgi:hypothetical protein